MTDQDEHINRGLLMQVAQGNEQAFRALYESYVPRLTPFIRSLVESESLVNDVIQQTFLSIWLGKEKLAEVIDAKAYIFRIAANTCYKIFRRSLVEKKVFHKMSSVEPFIHTGPEDALEVRELTRELERAIGSLSPQRKRIYLMSRQLGFTIPQIAVELGLSVNTVRNTLSSSLEYLREHLARNGYQLGILCIIGRIYNFL